MNSLNKSVVNLAVKECKRRIEDGDNVDSIIDYALCYSFCIHGVDSDEVISDDIYDNMIDDIKSRLMEVC